MHSSLIAALVLLATAAQAFELKTDKEGDVVRWTQKVKFVVDAKLDEKLHAPGAIGAVKAAFETWSLAAPNLGLTVEAGDTATASSTITVIESNWPYDDGVFAVTILKLDRTNNRIIEADIFINAAQNGFSVLPATSQRGGSYGDIQNTITHELGHALGLQHEKKHAHAVMYPLAYNGDVDKRTLSEDEIDGLDELYPLQAAATGCSVAGGSPAALFLAAALLLRRIRASR